MLNRVHRRIFCTLTHLTRSRHQSHALASSEGCVGQHLCTTGGERVPPGWEACWKSCLIATLRLSFLIYIVYADSFDREIYSSRIWTIYQLLIVTLIAKKWLWNRTIKANVHALTHWNPMSFPILVASLFLSSWLLWSYLLTAREET